MIKYDNHKLIMFLTFDGVPEGKMLKGKEKHHYVKVIYNNSDTGRISPRRLKCVSHYTESISLLVQTVFFMIAL